MPYLDEDYATYLPAAIDRLMMLKFMKSNGYSYLNFKFNDGEENLYLSQCDFFEHVGNVFCHHQVQWVNENLEDYMDEDEYEGHITFLKFTFLEDLSHYIYQCGKPDWEDSFESIKSEIAGFLEDHTCNEFYESYWAEKNLHIKAYQEPFVLMVSAEYCYRWNASLYNFLTAYQDAIQLYTEVMGTPPFIQESDCC